MQGEIWDQTWYLLLPHPTPKSYLTVLKMEQINLPQKKNQAISRYTLTDDDRVKSNLLFP